MTKRRWVDRFHRRLANPLARPLAGRWPGLYLLETTGRRTGLSRTTPVGGRMVDRTFWMVSDHGVAAGYVANLTADPRVRLRAAGRWHAGTARLVPDDDPRERLRTLPYLNGLLVRALGTSLTTVRVDLDPIP